MAFFAVFQFQMLIGGLCCDPSLGGAVEESELEEIGLDHVHDRILLLADRGGDGIQIDRSAAIFFDNRLEHAAVDIVQTKRIDLEQVKRFPGNILRNLPVCADLGIVTDSAQETESNARSPAGSRIAIASSGPEEASWRGSIRGAGGRMGRARPARLSA